jgi:hypothetical protein
VTYLHHLVLLVAAALLEWRVASLGLSAYFARSPNESVGTADEALAWNGRNPEALVRRELALRAEAPEAAASLAEAPSASTARKRAHTRA